jgi:hypothetical protein
MEIYPLLSVIILNIRLIHKIMKGPNKFQIPLSVVPIDKMRPYSRSISLNWYTWVFNSFALFGRCEFYISIMVGFGQK